MNEIFFFQDGTIIDYENDTYSRDKFCMQVRKNKTFSEVDIKFYTCSDPSESKTEEILFKFQTILTPICKLINYVFNIVCVY